MCHTSAMARKYMRNQPMGDAENYIITINRQFGSLGRPIARMLSEKLGIEYYDREIVDKAAKKLNMPVSEISELEESANGWLFSMKYPLGMGTTDVQDRIFKEQKKIIENKASTENCIIVGRCADAILKDHPNLIRIFIYSPKEKRLEVCVNEFQMTESEAKRMMLEVDKARDRYHKQYAGYLPDDLRHIDLAVDSFFLGVEGTVDFLEEYIKKYKEIKSI